MIRYENYIDSISDWQQIDIIVSRDCTLRCSYCYLQKSKDEFYDLPTIIKSLDDTLTEAENKGEDGIVIGLYPEPWANMERSNELLLNIAKTILKHPKYISNYMIMLGTNGVLLDKQIPMIEKLIDKISIAVTLDGIKEQHDMYRIFEDGSPSWNIIKNNILKYQKKYNIYATKVTLGPDTIKYIYESTLFLWDEMNFKDINMNVVFEDLWGDRLDECLKLFEEQLILLLEDIIKNKRWENQKFNGLFGTRNIPGSLIFDDMHEGHKISIAKPYCGASVMRSIDNDGSVYPCFRLSPYSLQGDTSFNVKNNERERALKVLNTFDAVPDKCRDCDLLGQCPMCVGGAYEEYNSIFARTTYHCEFQKLMAKYSYKLYKIINGVKDE